MNDKKERINLFLERINQIFAQTEGTKSIVYRQLTSLGVPQEQERHEINQHFRDWINYYRNSKTDVFVAENWRYFCQFISNNQEAKRSEDHLKIYVPLDEKHMLKGASLIFDFLEENNIPHLSKIGSHIRFDSIVIRLVNEEDVKKLADFVKNNKYLQEGLLPANPFTFNYNGIAMACDGTLSYNSTIAGFVNLYIHKCQREKSQPNYEGFYSFIEQYSKGIVDVELDQIDSNRIQRDFPDDEIYSSRSISDFRNIVSLILKSKSNDFSLEDYFDHYKNVKTLTEQEIKDTYSLSYEILETMIKQHPEQRETVIETFKEYIKTGKETYITRENDLRNKASAFGLNKMINKLSKVKKVTIDEFVNDTISLDENKIKQDIYDFITITQEKYGFESAVEMLKSYVLYDDLTYVTRSQNLRDNVEKNNLRNKIIVASGIYKTTPMIYINELVNKVFSTEKEMDPKEAINYALHVTYNKTLNRSNDIMAMIQIKKALSMAALNEDYTYFTRDQGAREQLVKAAPPEVLKQVILNVLGYKKDDLLRSSMIHTYVDLTFNPQPVLN